MVDDEIEKEIANALKPLEAHQGRQRPFMSMVDTPTPEPVNAVLQPPQAQEEPILTLTEHLVMIETQNTESILLLNERFDVLEAKLNAILAILK